MYIIPLGIEVSSLPNKSYILLFNNIGFKGKFFPDGIELGSVKQNVPLQFITTENLLKSV